MVNPWQWLRSAQVIGGIICYGSVARESGAEATNKEHDEGEDLQM